MIDKLECGDNETKDDKWGDIWCEAPESIIHREGVIPEADDGDKPLEEEANMALGCKARNC